MRAAALQMHENTVFFPAATRMGFGRAVQSDDDGPATQSSGNSDAN